MSMEQDPNKTLDNQTNDTEENNTSQIKAYDLDDSSQWYFFIIFSPFWIGFIIFLKITNIAFINITEGIVGFLIITALNFIWSRLYRNNYGFKITERGIEKEKGVINKTFVTLGYSRIQNVNIKRNILERMMGLSTLEIQTAGNNTSNAEGNIPGLSKERAREFRKRIVEKTYGPSNGNDDMP